MKDKNHPQILGKNKEATGKQPLPVIQANCAKSMEELNVSDNIVRLKVRFYPGEVFKDLLSDMDIETEADEDEDSSPNGGSTDEGNDGGGNGEGGQEFT